MGVIQGRIKDDVVMDVVLHMDILDLMGGTVPASLLDVMPDESIQLWIGIQDSRRELIARKQQHDAATAGAAHRLY